MERAFRPLWAEAPVDASEHPLVRELVPTVPESDGRQADALIHGMALGRGLPAEDVTAWQDQPACGDPYAVIGQVEEDDPLMPRDFDGWGSP